MFGKQKQINKRETTEEDSVIKAKNDIVKLEQEIKELEEETSDKPKKEVVEEKLVPRVTEVKKPEEETTKEEPEETKPEEKEEYWQVVKELPVQPVRRHVDEETGVVTNFLTTEEALTKILGEI